MVLAMLVADDDWPTYKTQHTDLCLDHIRSNLGKSLQKNAHSLQILESAIKIDHGRYYIGIILVRKIC